MTHCITKNRKRVTITMCTVYLPAVYNYWSSSNLLLPSNDLLNHLENSFRFSEITIIRPVHNLELDHIMTQTLLIVAIVIIVY